MLAWALCVVKIYKNSDLTIKLVRAIINLDSNIIYLISPIVGREQNVVANVQMLPTLTIDMEQYKGISIYTQEDFKSGCSIASARQQLEASTKNPSLIIFGTQLAGCNIKVGEHTRAIADVLGALTRNDADASETKSHINSNKTIQL